MKLLVRSFVLLVLLYGLVFAAGDFFLTRHGLPVWMAALFAGLVVGAQYWGGPRLIELLLKIRWEEEGNALPARNREFLEKLCAQRGLRMPRLGRIESDSPNAFTFGRFRGDARVVVTDGLLYRLDRDEIDAVLAHEMGHVEHHDFIVMTVAALAPLLLYEIYRAAWQNDKARPFAEGAYLLYLLSQFLVLSLSRTREYFADQYAARLTGEPDKLVSALLKIGYGIAAAEREQSRAVGAAALMGISNLRSGRELALGRYGGAGSASILRWDLVNPWARLYELNSTHPLTALRIRALNREAEAMHREVRCPLPEDQKIRWKAFPLELALWAAPWAGAATLLVSIGLKDWLWFAKGIVLPPHVVPSLLACTGVAWMLRTWFRYYGTFRRATIGELLEDVDVSQMRPRAVRLEGRILGFGVPGAFWCPDLVLRDATGLVYVLYRQSIPFAGLFFALSRAEQYFGKDVVIEGWFRRGLTPCVEMWSLTGADGKRRRAWSRWVQHAVAASMVLGGLVMLEAIR